MEFINKIIAFILSLFGLISYIPSQSQTEIPESAATCDVTIMSYNVYVAGTGSRSPRNRSEGVIYNLRNIMPDIFGLQEADYDWMQRIIEGMPEYSYVGRGREKSETDGEYSPVFYKTDKYNLIDSGTFWFSNTPDKASSAWGTIYKRICTWAVLEDKETGFTFAVFNSHWDHISYISRNNSAELLLEKIEEYAPNMPVIITGDFNCKANTTAYETLINGGFVDSMYVSEITADMGTYHGYTKSDTSGELPIDHILFKDEYGYSNSYSVITDKYNGIYPSDHFPIVSEITLYV
ncbi:MAG: endonuclease/exonuclease/phosphatase family protein [Clostridiales bacterium]|nr:endonuclease/exonuclease/phosphatase family protein [Clostridiales bacterium]